MPPTSPACFHLEPVAVPRPWGGQRLSGRFGWEADAPRGEPCGEWWLASCRPGAVNRLRDGPGDLAGWLEGPGRSDGGPSPDDFPLLVKFLDCAQTLSLQVHPDDAVAREHGLSGGKSEAWFVLEADAGAGVLLGTAPGVSGARLLDRVAAGADDEEIRSLLQRVPLRTGDALHVPAGSVHAIEGGLALFEVQQNSDTTYRIHDWGRGRELHLEQARDALVDRAPAGPLRAPPSRDGWHELLACAAFTLRRGRCDDTLAYSPPGPFATLTVIDGSGSVGDGLDLAPGDTLWVRAPLRLTGQGLELLVVEPPR